MFHAYLITCITNGRRYIGITSRKPANRWSEHLYDGRSRTTRMAICRAIAKYGANNFQMEVLCCALTWDDICAVEQILIAQWDTRNPHGYNISKGGEGAFGVKRTAASVELSASKHRGKPCHPNTISAASRTHRGVKKSDLHRERIAAARLGCTHTEQTKAKIAAYWATRRASGSFKTAEPYAHARKAASAISAKVPLPLARHIARVYRPAADPVDAD